MRDVEALKHGRLIISYSEKRARKDKRNREKGLKRLEKKVQTGKLTKDHINNRGHNKYLKLTGDINILIDYEKYDADNAWDGLKGYITRNKIGISPAKAIEAIQGIKQLRYMLPKSKQIKTMILQPTDMQTRLIDMKI